ncbi:hypothetical protein GCM10011383_37140 [Hymenobacter cavernae]|uniref:STAS/SEC14 domain-containing protein n=2 Tax=Hymenobacter cavernae TaxID=2044852 RepID=A0ABQ1UMH7_9BACT|nr:hypothetical protein GCM10011383_37140 [Hymenobacter cavernae]
MLVHSNTAGSLRAEQAGQYLHLHWNEGQREDAMIVELFDRVLTYLLQTGWRRILVNQQRMQSSSPEVQSWFRADWLPHAASQLGPSRAAIVVGQDVFTRLATVSLMRDATLTVAEFPDFSYQLFHYEQEAQRWLVG